ncbi:hypothetical protein Tco_0872140 [Tanacetum coccineum]
MDKSKPVTSCSTPKNEQGQKKNVNVIARGMYRVIKTETQTPVAKSNMFSSNSTRVASSSSVSRPESKDNKLKKRVLLNTQSKSTSKDFKKSKNVFMISRDKYVARYALSANSIVKRALFTSLVAAKSSKLGATLVVVKPRFSVVTPPPKTTNKVSRASSLTPESSQSRTLGTYMKTKIKTNRKWHKWFKHQPSFNWSPKSPTAQTPSSVTESSASARTYSRTLVTKQKWVAKLSTLPSIFSSCGASDPERPLDC